MRRDRGFSLMPWLPKEACREVFTVENAPTDRLPPRRLQGKSRSARRLGVIAAFTAAAVAHAGGPRWFAGPPYFTVEGSPVAFFTPDVLYYTDPGTLNANVTHAQADAMVAAAAAVWNVPTARLTLAQGGTLAEHVSSANLYFNGASLVVPDDIQPAHYLAKPLAVVYDTDGSVIDSLLGSGASLPSGCRQNGVVEFMDGIDPGGTIHHATLLLNGRCVGSSADQLTQMQYQLMRAFGRALGVGWSQLNDNVFTGTPQPTSANMANWPVMHPIDVLCGPYTFKCMQSPFTLRTDDLSTLALLYGVNSANIIPGKVLSQQSAVAIYGWINFPTGQGMDAVNIVLLRQTPFTYAEATPVVSAVTGVDTQSWAGNPVTGAAVGLAQSYGSRSLDQQGLYVMQRVPIVGTVGWNSLYFSTEPINPLYTGSYAISGYSGAPTAMSGTSITHTEGLVRNTDGTIRVDLSLANTAVACNPGNDGVEAAPVAVDPSGFWTGQLCSSGHSSWLSHIAEPGRTWTLEVTALDDAGSATTTKAHPLLGLYRASDPLGTQPTVASAVAPFNSQSVGTTQLRVTAAPALQAYRAVITDERGHGRPDFNYRARLLYADSVTPAQIGKGGGLVTLSGMGFRQGNTVRVNGVAATVLSWTPNQILALAPTLSAANMTTTGYADVAVVDTGTGASTTIQAALSYAGTAIDAIVLISAPTTVETGTVSSVPFAARVFLSDGITPAQGATVSFQATNATLTACGAAACTLTADASGLVQTTLIASGAGLITLTATETSGGASVQSTVNAFDPVRVVTALTPSHVIAPNAPATWTFSLVATQDAQPAVGQPVLWTASSGLTLQTAPSLTSADGSATATLTTPGLAAGTTATVQGCVWVSVCAGASLTAADPAGYRISIVSGAGQAIASTATFAPVVFLVTDAAGHPVESATVTIAQTLDAWAPPCPATGRCPASPVLASSRRTYTTDVAGGLSITPLQIPGTAGVTNIAAITGDNGFLALSLPSGP